MVLGGTGQLGDWNTDVDDRDQQMIWDGCLEMVPSLKVCPQNHCKFLKLSSEGRFYEVRCLDEGYDHYVFRTNNCDYSVPSFYKTNTDFQFTSN